MIKEVIEHVICKKFRKIFKNVEYKTFLANKFKTFFRKRNGLLLCQSVTPQCKIIHNRNKNAV